MFLINSIYDQYVAVHEATSKTSCCIFCNFIPFSYVGTKFCVALDVVVALLVQNYLLMMLHLLKICFAKALQSSKAIRMRCHILLVAK